MSDKKVLFRASAVGKLMVGGNGITEKQLQELDALMERHSSVEQKPLTTRMLQRMDLLIEKKNRPFELGATAKTYVREVWLRGMFGYDEPVITDEMTKGHLVEQDCMELVGKVIKSNTFRVKNRDNFENEWFTGSPDVILKEGIVEDMKAPYTLRTFLEAKLTKLYYTQLQVYMDLLGFKKARVVYALVNTPPHIVTEIKKRYWFKLNCDVLDDTAEYQEVEKKIDIMHNFNHIAPEKRVKCYEIEYNEEYMRELKKRVEAARRYYDTIELNQIDAEEIIDFLPFNPDKEVS